MAANVCLSAVEGFPPDQPGEIRNPDALRPASTVVTPHTCWARDNAAGTTKALFIAPRGALREVIELAQRMDLDHRVVALDSASKLSGTAEGAARLIWGTRRKAEVLADLTEALRQTYDVIVVGHVVPEVLPADAWAAIAAHVRRGAGLILCPPQPAEKGKPPLDGLLASAASVPFPDAIAEAFPASLRQAMFDDWSDGKTAPFEAYNLGAGRVLLARFAPGAHGMITPGLSLERHLSSPYLFDYRQAVAVRALLWTAKRLASEGPSVESAPAEATGPSARITVRPPAGTGAAVKWIELNVRDGNDKRLFHAVLPAADPVRFDVPVQALPVGEHFADVWLRDAEQRTLDWRTVLLPVADAQGITAVAVKPDFVAPGAPVTATITLKQPLRENERLELNIADFHGRVTARETVRPAGGTSLTAKLSVGQPLSILCDLAVELWRGDRLVDRQRGEIAIEQPAGGAGWDDFSWMYWCFRDDAIAHMSMQQLLPYGLDRIMVERGNVDKQVREAALVARTCNAKAFPYAWHMKGNPHQMSPKGLTGKFKPLAEQLMRYGCDTLSMGDENMLGAAHAPFENLMEPTFRQAMKSRYGTLEALNAAWGSAFDKWDDVTGIDYGEARKSFQHAHFLDTRRYLDDLFARFHALGRETARAVSPRYRVGFEGAYRTQWSSGYDWWRLMNNIDVMGNYWFTPAEIPIARSFKTDNAYWGFWNGAYMDVHNRWTQGWIAWRSLFWGMNSVWWWCSLPGAGVANPFHILYPDLRISPEVLPFLESVREIKAGPGKLLLGAKRLDVGIGIHYSQASLHADALDNYGFKAAGVGIPTRIQDAWMNFTFGLGDAGLPYRFVSYEQVEKGEFGDLRVMILPFSQAVSKKEADALRAFVERGGLLIADIRPGVFDELGRPANPGMLDDLFGIRRLTAEAAVKPDAAPAALATAEPEKTLIGDSQDLALKFESGGKALDLELPHTQVDRAVALSGGQARASDADVPLLIERKHGKGRALLLNFASEYAVAPYNGKKGLGDSPEVKRVRGSGRDDAWVNLLRAAMAESGVRPELTLTSGGERLRGVEAVAWHDGAARYYGFTVADFTDYALVCTGPDRSVSGALERGGHLYDVRQGKYLGEGASFESVLPRGGAGLIAVLPYKVEDVEAVAPKDAQRGAEIAIPFAVRATAKPGRHVLRVRAFDPDGRERPEYAANVEAPAGQGVYRLPLALSDPAGAWTVVARDVASGTERALTLKVR